MFGTSLKYYLTFSPYRTKKSKKYAKKLYFMIFICTGVPICKYLKELYVRISYV